MLLMMLRLSREQHEGASYGCLLGYQANSIQHAYSDNEAPFRVDPEVHDALITLLPVGRPRMSTLELEPLALTGPDRHLVVLLRNGQSSLCHPRWRCKPKHGGVDEYGVDASSRCCTTSGSKAGQPIIGGVTARQLEGLGLCRPHTRAASVSPVESTGVSARWNASPFPACVPKGFRGAKGNRRLRTALPASGFH